MSQQAVYNVDFEDEEILIESLKEMGFKPTVHKKAVQLHTYAGSAKAHIVLSKKQENFTYADMGFERTKNGLKLHADHIDIKKLNMSILTQTYVKASLAKRMRLMGSQYSLGKSEIDGTGTMKLKIKVTM